MAFGHEENAVKLDFLELSDSVKMNVQLIIHTLKKLPEESFCAQKSNKLGIEK